MGCINLCKISLACLQIILQECILSGISIVQLALHHCTVILSRLGLYCGLCLLHPAWSDDLNMYYIAEQLNDVTQEKRFSVTEDIEWGSIKL